MPTQVKLTTLWLADDFTYDGDGGRWTLHRTFDTLCLPPGANQYDNPFTVFFSATNVTQRCEWELTLTDLSDLVVVYQRPVILEAEADRFAVVDMTLRVNTLSVPGPGTYMWDLIDGDDSLSSVRMTVVSADGELA